MGSALLPWMAGANGKKVQEYFQCTCWASHWEASILFPCSGKWVSWIAAKIWSKYDFWLYSSSLLFYSFPHDKLPMGLNGWMVSTTYVLPNQQSQWCETIRAQPLRAQSAQQQAYIWQVSLNLLLPAAVEEILIPEFITLLLSPEFTWSLKISKLF